jgi:hypothetical protein
MDNTKISGINFFSPLFPLSGVRIAVPIVLAQHKEYDRIGEARIPLRCALPIVI